jgi:hypothetical protein
MALSYKKPPRTGDRLTDKALQAIYKDLNIVIGAVNNPAQDQREESGSIGDLRVNADGLQFHSEYKWETININWILAQIDAKLTIVEVPTSATAIGISGQVAYSLTHFYICVSDNVWKRVAIGTWS